LGLKPEGRYETQNGLGPWTVIQKPKPLFLVG